MPSPGCRASRPSLCRSLPQSRPARSPQPQRRRCPKENDGPNLGNSESHQTRKSPANTSFFTVASYYVSLAPTLRGGSPRLLLVRWPAGHSC